MSILSRLLILILACLCIPAPAAADDISAAGRSVVRVVVIAFEDGEVVDFGHGSGFAVAGDRVVTNAHVVQLATEWPEGVVIGVVPSEGSQAYRARLVTTDPSRDLALLQLEEGRIPPIPLFSGALDDGSPVTALGYPGNVDLATAQSAADYIVPVPPTRSAGIFSNQRMIGGIATLLHTASIARGHSGGPLLDSCGRVIGVNTLITRNEAGESGFAFAVANRELAAFLTGARQPFRSVTTECVSMDERLRQDEARSSAQAQAAQAAEAERLGEARLRRLILLSERREDRAGLALLLLAFSLVAAGGGGILLLKDRQRPALLAAGASAILLAAAILVFVTRPGLSDLDPTKSDVPTGPTDTAEGEGASRRLCTFVAERSRVTVSATGPVSLDFRADGCVNGRTQYARNGDSWSRILVPDSEQTVSVLRFRPAQNEYVVSRYLLPADRMDQVRALRRGVDVKACTGDAEARTILADQLRDIEKLLPRLPNERLVYRCETQG